MSGSSAPAAPGADPSHPALVAREVGRAPPPRYPLAPSEDDRLRVLGTGYGDKTTSMPEQVFLLRLARAGVQRTTSRALLLDWEEHNARRGEISLQRP